MSLIFKIPSNFSPQNPRVHEYTALLWLLRSLAGMYRSNMPRREITWSERKKENVHVLHCDFPPGTLTGVGVHREVRLALQDAVHHLGAVPVRGVVGVHGRHLNDGGAWTERKIHDNHSYQLIDT